MADLSCSDDSDFDVRPTLENVLEQDTLKWIFVGGKGGVGKTTTSCALATALAGVRRNVLIISTDPAHNLSDAFCQKFSSEPTAVTGFDNLFAMEIDPKQGAADREVLEGFNPTEMLSEITNSIPGIDEAMSFAEVMRLVQTMDYDCVVFDTAPTGHTLRFLAFPEVLQKGLAKVFSLKSKFGSLFEEVSSLMGDGGSQEQIESKIEKTQLVVEEVERQFKNPDLTTFVCVCIPEFLSLYETERLVQELAKHEIDVHNIVVNQIVYPDDDSTCRICKSRVKMQSKYLEQIDDLYADMNVVKMPQLTREIRGDDDLRRFAGYLMTPYVNTPEERALWEDDDDDEDGGGGGGGH